MPQFSRSLDVYQGFNFKKDKQSPVGFITKLVVGEMTMVADQKTVMDPTNPTKAIEGGVVGVMNHYLWETGVTDAMYLAAQVSTANKQELSTKLLGELTNLETTFSYVIYEYDPMVKKYFLSNKGTDLKGILEKRDGDLSLKIANSASLDVQSPKNFSLQIGIKPPTQEQSIELATAYSKNMAKKWGVGSV